MYRSCVYFLKPSTIPKNVENRCFRSILNGVPQVMCKIAISSRCLSRCLQSSTRLKCSSPKIGSLSRHYSERKLETPKISFQSENSLQTNDSDSTTHTHLNSHGETEEDLFSNIDYKEICGEDEETLNKFKLLMLEVDVLRQDGMRVPKQLTTDSWKELFALQTRSQRRKLLDFLWTIEMKQLGSKRKKEIKRQVIEEKQAQLLNERKKNDHIHYGFQGNTIFLRIYETAMNVFFNNRLIQAMQFGQNVVIDCGFDQDMSVIENKLCAKQLTFMFAENRNHCEPFNLHFCNFNKDSVLFKQLYKSIPTIDDPAYPINITEENYLNLFPRDKLVYLTPHCRTELHEFNHDDIYIIGALVDKRNTDPLSMAKAKSQGIRMAKFPLDRYLDWSIGTKSLTINQTLNILLDLRTSGDWNKALKNVPQRKIRREGQPVKDPRNKKPIRRGTADQPPSGYKVYQKWAKM